MARRRYLHPEHPVVHVSFMCVDDQYLLRPDPRTVFICGQALAEALQKYSVKLYAVGIVSNHGHLILGIDGGARLDSFMQYFKSRVALRLNALRKREGAFFKRRYRMEPILSDADVVSMVGYVHAQPVRHGLVARVEDWLGLCSFRAVVDGKDALDVAWLDEEAWNEAGARQDEIALFTEKVSIPLSPLPHWQGLSPRELGAQRRAMLASERDHEAEMEAKRIADRVHLPRPASFAKVDPRSRPKNKKRSQPQPWAHGTPEQVRAYREAYSTMLATYTVASEQYRTTGVLCPFPIGTFPPRIPVPMAVT